MPTLPFRLLLITDRHATFGREGEDVARLVEVVSTALHAAPAGSMAVMVREKDLCGGALLSLCKDLRAKCRAAGALLLVNDRVDVALAAGADGVHLPSSGLPVGVARELLGEEALIGVSTHSVEDAARAAAQGADYVSFGPIFDTPSKRAYGEPVGVEALSLASRLRRPDGTPFPIIGLGGITEPAHAREVMGAGAHGVACIRAVIEADEPGEATARFLSELSPEAWAEPSSS